MSKRSLISMEEGPMGVNGADCASEYYPKNMVL